VSGVACLGLLSSRLFSRATVILKISWVQCCHSHQKCLEDCTSVLQICKASQVIESGNRETIIAMKGFRVCVWQVRRTALKTCVLPFRQFTERACEA